MSHVLVILYKIAFVVTVYILPDREQWLQNSTYTDLFKRICLLQGFFFFSFSFSFFFFYFYSYSYSYSYSSSTSFSFFFFLVPVSLRTAALGLLCSPDMSFSTASITLRLVWRGKSPSLRLWLCLLVLQSASERHYSADKPTSTADTVLHCFGLHPAKSADWIPHQTRQ